MFENMLKSLTSYFDCKEITSQMIDEYVQSVKDQAGGESDEENEAIIGMNPTKKLQLGEISAPASLVSTANIQPIGTKTAKGTGSKVLSNLIQISLDEATPLVEQQTKAKKGAANSKAKGSKKAPKNDLAENLEKAEVVILDMPPDSPKQKRKPAKKKSNGREKEKEIEDIINEFPNKTSGIKVGDLSDINKSSMITIDQPQMMPQNFPMQYNQAHMLLQQPGFAKPEDDLKNKLGMMMQNNMIAPMFALNQEDLTRILQGTVPQLNANGDKFSPNKMLYGMGRPFM